MVVDDVIEDISNKKDLDVYGLFINYILEKKLNIYGERKNFEKFYDICKKALQSHEALEISEKLDIDMNQKVRKFGATLDTKRCLYKCFYDYAIDHMPKNSKVIDAACGVEAEASIYLAQNDYQVKSVDPQLGRPELLKKFGIKPFKSRLETAQDLFKDKVDFIVANNPCDATDSVVEIANNLKINAIIEPCTCMQNMIDKYGNKQVLSSSYGKSKIYKEKYPDVDIQIKLYDYNSKSFLDSGTKDFKTAFGIDDKNYINHTAIFEIQNK